MDNRDIWQKYENCREYMNGKGLVSETDKNWSFYAGDQWKGIESGGEKLPIMNFIKPIVKFKVATVAQNTMVAVYSDMEDSTNTVEVCKLLSKNFAKNWEKSKMDSLIWKVIRAAAVQGDSYLYFGTGDVTDVQIIHNTNIMFGDEQERDLQKQPYILIYERVSVDEVREIAKENKAEGWDLITSDEETSYSIGNKTEVKGDGKISGVVYLEKKDGIVHAARAVQNCVYEPLRGVTVEQNGEIVGGLKSYPIVSFIWEELPNNARGNSEVKQLIPNQIELNKTVARRSMSVKMTAFPRIAYDATAIQNKDDLEIVGAAIGLNGTAGGIDSLIKYLNPASMSHDAEVFQNDILSNTRELAGAGDAAVGNINPERASGEAIQAVRDQSALPLNEQVASYKQFTEDLALLWFDMLQAYSPGGVRLEYTDDEGNNLDESIDGDTLSMLKPNVRIDVSPDNAWTKFAEQQELANLLSSGQITLEEYIEVLPDNSALPKNKLKAQIAKRGANNVQMQEMRGGVPEAGGAESVQGALPAL